MKKLKLEDIHVESYATVAVRAEAGTVQANAATIISCGGSCRTCDVTNCTCESGVYCC
jgi:hypothetical protein